MNLKQVIYKWFYNYTYQNFILIHKTRRFSNHESRLLSRAHTFAIIVILDLKIHQSMWILWSFFPKTWTKSHWPLHGLWPHVCWGHMCDSTQGSLCPSPMTIHQCMWIQWSILQITTYIHILPTCYAHTTYILHTYHIQNEWSHSLLLNSVQARQWLLILHTKCILGGWHPTWNTSVSSTRPILYLEVTLHKIKAVGSFFKCTNKWSIWI